VNSTVVFVVIEDRAKQPGEDRQFLLYRWYDALVNQNPFAFDFMGIRKAMQKEIKLMKLADTGLTEDDVGPAGSWSRIEKLYVPPVEKQAEFLKGSPEEVATKITEILLSLIF
jgi:electron transfer flavoprotein alpha/beta subunit